MSRRMLTSVMLVAAFLVAIVFAWRAAYIEGNKLLFDSFWWLIVAAPFAGLAASGVTRRKDPVIEGDRVLRHDDAAMLSHWTHGIGTMFLLITGIALGLLFVPSLLPDDTAANAMMNVHFVCAVVFLFGTFYYLGNTYLSPKRFAEHLPTRNAVDYTKRHYGLLLGFKKFTFPPEAKYFESEKMAYILALASSVLIILTGFVKVAAHITELPGSLMGAVTLVHDVSTVAMLAFFLAHVFFAAVLPMSWPVLKSMLTGYVSLAHAKHEHAGWIEELSAHDTEAASASRDA